MASLSTPRVAIIMVQAGPPTDTVIEQLATHMDPGDIMSWIAAIHSIKTPDDRASCASAACTSWELASLEARRHCSARRSCRWHGQASIVSAPCSGYRSEGRRRALLHARRLMERATL